MKRMIAILVCLVLLVAVCPASRANAGNVVKLSELSDLEILEFIEDYEITIPDGFAESDTALASIIRSWIIDVENDPNLVFLYNFTDLYDVATAVRDAVNSYYGYIGSEPTISTYASHGLQYSTLYTIPENMLLYNCYSYVLGVDTAIRDPGFYSLHTLNQTSLNAMSIAELAEYVMDDLKSESFGYLCVSDTAIRPVVENLSVGQTAICMRKGPDRFGNHDYHFMKLFNDNGNKWRHKPGKTAILTYDYMPTISRDWISEGYDGSRVINDGITYNSNIRYIIYSNTHDYGAGTSTGHNYHSGLSHFYQYSATCELCGYSYTYYTSKPCDGSSCGGMGVLPKNGDFSVCE